MPAFSLRRNRGLFLQSLEARIAPANTINVVDALASTNIISQPDQQTGEVVFSTTGPGALLDIKDIEAAFALPGITVIRVVTDVHPNGTDGGEAGDIIWDRTVVGRDLQTFIQSARTLQLRPAANSGGDIILTDTLMNSNQQFGELSFSFDTSSSGGDILFNALPNQPGVRFSSLGDVSVVSGGSFTYADAASAATAITGVFSASAPTMNILPSGGISAGQVKLNSGNMHLSANLQGGSLVELKGSVVLGSNVRLSTFEGDGEIDIFANVNGANSLTVAAASTQISQGSIGSGTPLSSLEVERGELIVAAPTVKVGQLVLGSGVETREATLSTVTGLLDADVLVLGRGRISPAGSGTAGVLAVAGSVTFEGGTLEVDLGANMDRLDVEGLSIGNFGGFLDGNGTLSGPGNVVIVKNTGASSGQFSNAPLNVPILIGLDAIQVTSYSPNVTVAQVDSQTGGIFAGFEADGTGVSAKLKGPGELVVVDGAGGLSFVIRGTTLSSSLTLTTKANTSDAIAEIDRISIGGSLKAFTAKTSNILNGLNSSGTIQTITVRDIRAGGIDLGGAPADKTKLIARNLSGPVTSDSTLLSLTVRGNLTGALDVAALGTAKISGDLSGNWNVGGGITSLTAARISNFTLDAVHLGVLTVSGNKPLDLVGDVIGSTFTLTGNSGANAGSFGLKSAKITGNVVGSLFDVEEGNVGKFSVGRFRNSHLLLDYSPDADFATTGTFDSNAVFTLGSFNTTAATLNSPGNANDYGFANGTIVADTIQKVRLSGVRTSNNTVSFGIKARNSVGSIQVKSSDDSNLPVNQDLGDSVNPIAVDFWIRKI